MTKFLSGRQKNLKIGITSYSENTQVLEVIGRVGIGSTVFNAGYDLDVRGTSRFSGNVTLGANLYPDTDGLYDVGRAPNRWKDANFLGKGTFGTGVSAHDIEIGVGAANLIYSTSGNLELNSTSGTTNIDDIVTISGNLGIGTVNPTSKLSVVGAGNFIGTVTATEFYGSGIGLTGLISNEIVDVSNDQLYYPILSPVTSGTIPNFSVSSDSIVFNPAQNALGIGTTSLFTGANTGSLTISGKVVIGNSVTNPNISNVLNASNSTGVAAYRAFNLIDTSSVIKVVRLSTIEAGPAFELQHWSTDLTENYGYWDFILENGHFALRDRTSTVNKTRFFVSRFGNFLIGANSSNIGINSIQSVGYGTDNILQVNGNSYLGGSVGIGTTTPTSKLWVDGDGYFTGVVTATTFIGNLTGTATTATNLSNAANITTGTIDKDRLLNSNSFSVLGDLYVSNNISFGGTTTQLNLQQLQIVDADIVLGIGTSFSPTDNTANHGGIAIASTEGSPLVNLNIVPEETNPSTYKKIMWFKGDAIGAGITDAWLFNYAVGVGSTRVPNGVRLAAGGMQVTDTTISTPNLNVSGIVTSNAYYIGTTQVINSARQLQNIASLDATTTATIETAIQQAPNDFTSLNITGISTLQSTTLIGGGTSTGTANQLLQVNGSAYIAGDGSAGLSIGSTNNTTYPFDLRLPASGSTAAMMRIAPTTTNKPAGIVYANGGSSANMWTGVLNSSGAGQNLSGFPAYAGLVGLTAGTTPLIFATNAIERVRVADTGEVGIGTTNPLELLHVLGSTGAARFENTSNAYSVTISPQSSGPRVNFGGSGGTNFIEFGAFVGTNNLDTKGRDLKIYSTAVPSAFILRQDTGNIGIGTTNPTSKLHVVGDTYISGILTATDINSASDIRLKTNIKPFENTLEKIVQINGVSFNWIDSNAKSGGIIAQDVEKVFPELVNDGDHKTVNYNGLIGVLIESIKELKQEVEDLKSRLSES